MANQMPQEVTKSSRFSLQPLVPVFMRWTVVFMMKHSVVCKLHRCGGVQVSVCHIIENKAGVCIFKNPPFDIPPTFPILICLYTLHSQLQFQLLNHPRKWIMIRHSVEPLSCQSPTVLATCHCRHQNMPSISRRFLTLQPWTQGRQTEFNKGSLNKSLWCCQLSSNGICTRAITSLLSAVIPTSQCCMHQCLYLFTSPQISKPNKQR